MITLAHLADSGSDFGVHCPTKEDVVTLVGHIYSTYPEKQNHRVDLYTAWDEFGCNTVIFPNLLNHNWATYGRLGGNASLKRKIYAMSDLEVPDELPFEQSDMDISFVLGL